MKLSILWEYLQGGISIEALKEAISGLVKEWVETQNQGGTVFPYNYRTVEEDSKEFTIENKHVKRLCLDFLEDRLDEIELVFLGNLLLIIEFSCEECRFDSEALEDAMSSIANPGDVGPLTKTFIQEILDKEISQGSS